MLFNTIIYMTYIQCCYLLKNTKEDVLYLIYIEKTEAKFSKLFENVNISLVCKYKNKRLSSREVFTSVVYDMYDDIIPHIKNVAPFKRSEFTIIRVMGVCLPKLGRLKEVYLNLKCKESFSFTMDILDFIKSSNIIINELQINEKIKEACRKIFDVLSRKHHEFTPILTERRNMYFNQKIEDFKHEIYQWKSAKSNSIVNKNTITVNLYHLCNNMYIIFKELDEAIAFSREEILAAFTKKMIYNEATVEIEDGGHLKIMRTQIQEKEQLNKID